MIEMDMHELYTTNPDFRTYVDKCCSTYRLTVEQALGHELVKAVADQYVHPDDTYSFGNLEPLRRLNNADMIRTMNDLELAEDRVDSMNKYRSPYKGYVGDFEGVCDSREQAVAAELKWLKQEV